MRHKLRVLACAAFTMFIAGAQVCDAETSETTEAGLQRAINLINKNPTLAANQFKQYKKSATAESFLAYLYFTHRNLVNQPGKNVDKLMNDAIFRVRDDNSLGEITPAKHYHYADLAMLVRHLRFITDSDAAGISIPPSVISQHPNEWFEAFGPYWGSTRDGFLSLDVPSRENVNSLPPVSRFTDVLEAMMGNQSGHCTGTMRNMYFRKQSLVAMEASVAPQMFTASAIKTRKAVDPDLNDFLEDYSYQELWNRQKVAEWKATKQLAATALASYYQQHFKMAPAAASACAENAVLVISSTYLNEYSHSSLAERRQTKAFKLFAHPYKSVAELKQALGSDQLAPADLVQGLRMATLNGTNVDVIEWLIQQGAPVEGGDESPLFTAVMRPEVVSALLKAGAVVDKANDIGKTALIQAAQFDALETMKLLVQTGANPKAVMVALDSEQATKANDSCSFDYTIGGRTPLMYATMFASYPTVKYLIDQGVDKKAKASNGDTAVKYLTGNSRLSAQQRTKLAADLR